MKNTALRALIPLGVTALVLAGCTAGDDTTEPTEDSSSGSDTLRMNWGAFPESWTPGYEFEGSPMRVVYETLIGWDEAAGELAPGLASSWEFNDDTTQLTLTLQEGVTFHDGEPFDAEAVKLNLETIQATPGPFGGQLAPITSIDTPDESTVVLNFSAPTPSMVNTLSTRVAPMASPASLDDGSSATTPVGTAPWAYDESASTVGTVMVFTQYEDYWGEMPAFENVEMYAIPEDEAAAAALVNGEIDVTDTDYAVLTRFDDTDVETFQFPAIRNNLIFFDRGPGGIFEEQLVRQSLCYAVDHSQYGNIDPTSVPDTQHFIEGEQGYNSDIDGYPYDLDMAISLWEEAGSPEVQGEMIAAPFTNDQSSVYMDLAGDVPGIDIQVTQVPPPEWFQGWNSGQYPIGLGSNDEQTPFEWYKSWFAADAGANASGVESDELKAAADAAIAAGDSEEADALWAEVTKIIADEALTCAHGKTEQIIAFDAATVTDVESYRAFEPNSINLRAIQPAG